MNLMLEIITSIGLTVLSEMVASGVKTNGLKLDRLVSGVAVKKCTLMLGDRRDT